jgi:hypothetical protein
VIRVPVAGPSVAATARVGLLIPVAVVVLCALAAGPPPDVPELQWSGVPTAQAADMGLEAYAAGDYAETARWLGSVTLFAPEVSHAAAMAMGDLYERGLGVPLDYRRAWVMYVLATLSGDRGLERLATGAKTRVEMAMSAEDLRLANAMLSSGFREGLQPTVLHVDGGSWIEIAPPEAFIIRKGQREEFPLQTEFGDVFVTLSGFTAYGRLGAPRQMLQDVRWRVVGTSPEITRELLLTVYDLQGNRGCSATLVRVHGLEMLPDSLTGQLVRHTRLSVNGQGELLCQPPRDLPWLRGTP